MDTEDPWHLKLFFNMLIAASPVMFVVVVGYHMGYHLERAGVLTLAAVAVVTLLVLRSRARRWEPRVRPPPVAETPRWSPASLVYLVFGAATVAMILVCLAAVVVGPWVVSGGVVAAYLASRIVWGTRAVGSAGEGSGGGQGPRPHPPSLREQMARESDIIAVVLLWTTLLYMGVAILWSTYTPYPQDKTVAAAQTGMAALVFVLMVEANVWRKRSQTDRAGSG